MSKEDNDKFAIVLMRIEGNDVITIIEEDAFEDVNYFINMYFPLIFSVNVIDGVPSIGYKLFNQFSSSNVFIVDKDFIQYVVSPSNHMINVYKSIFEKVYDNMMVIDSKIEIIEIESEKENKISKDATIPNINELHGANIVAFNKRNKETTV